MLRLLLRIGLVRRRPDGSIRWPIHVAPRHAWVGIWRAWPLFGVFRNLPEVIKWEPGRMLPRRWGFRVWILEVGDRG